MFLDLAEPYRALGVAARALRAGGVLVCYVPTAIQLHHTVEALNSDGGFGEVESFETLLRNWHVKGMSVRPMHRMVAHSGFIIVGRRLAAVSRAASAPLEAVSAGASADEPSAASKNEADDKAHAHDLEDPDSESDAIDPDDD
jgi:tRNA (adenine57-N1/adenine58-N1)-methyltransferase